MTELKLERGIQMTVGKDASGKDDIMNFKVIISPDDGLYRGGRFVFDFKVAATYPHDVPKVRRRPRRRRGPCLPPGADPRPDPLAPTPSPRPHP